MTEREGIKSEVEKHLVKTFLGSMDPILDNGPECSIDVDHPFV